MSTNPTTANRPEHSISLGGLGVAVWRNVIETSSGSRQVRNVTISGRRYRDAQTGEWKDAGSFRPGDLPVLMTLLSRALDFCMTTPLVENGEAD